MQNGEPSASLAVHILAAVRLFQLHGPRNRATEAALARLLETLRALFSRAQPVVSLQAIDRFLIVGTTQIEGRDEVAVGIRTVFRERGIGGVVFRSLPDPGSLSTWLAAFARPVNRPEDAELTRAQLRALRGLGIETLEPKSIASIDEYEEVDVTAFHYALEVYGRTIVGAAELIENLQQGQEPFSGRIPVIRCVQELIDIAAHRPEHLLELLERERRRGWQIEEPYAVVHAVNTCVWAVLIGRTVELDRAQLLDLATSALLADVGFALSFDDLLNQPRELSRVEHERLNMAMIRASQALVGSSRVTPEMMRRAIVAYEHHGPIADVVTGEPVHPFSRIVAVADAFDALTHSRAWRDAMSLKQAFAVLSRNAGTKFDPLAVTALGAVLHAAGHIPPPAR